LFLETELVKQHSDFQIMKNRFCAGQKHRVALDATAQLEHLRSIDDHQLSNQLLQKIPTCQSERFHEGPTVVF
jgi:hypothetical protein